MEELLKAYYADNAKKLRGLVDKILSKFGGLSDKDRDDFYSLANEVFVDTMRRCEDIEAFDVFLYACLSNKIKTEMSKINCEKRKADRMSVSIDAPAGDDTGLTVGDLIADRFDMENEVFEKMGQGYGMRTMLYLRKLSKLQREVLQLAADGYASDEIKETLKISEKHNTYCKPPIHNYRNDSIMF